MQPIRIALPTGLGVGDVNVYLFTGPEPVLVDAGIKSDASWEALQLGLAEHGLTVLDLSRVIITHPHVDHYGQAGTIVAHSDADVWISELGAPWLVASAEQWARRNAFYSDSFLPSTGLPPEAVQMITEGLAFLAAQSDPVPAERLHTFRLDGQVQMGGAAWQVLHTPGHASTQTCFFEPQTHLLLSADMLLATTPTPVVESPPDDSSRRVPALPLFLESLDLLEALEIELVLPGHGRPFRDYRRVIDQQRQRIAQRAAECLRWIQAGQHTPAELLEKMYGHRPVQFRFAGLWMLMGYLDLLEADGLVRRDLTGGVWHYTVEARPA